MYSFVILHYKNIEETIECLTKLQNLFKDKCHIIIVDNNTLSKSEEKLIQKFTKDILKLDKNYGFAKANNKGIAYAKKKYKSKYFENSVWSACWVGVIYYINGRIPA